LLICGVIFWCVCVWVQPFVDTDHFVHNYFPAREYAIIIPGLAGAALISFVLVFVGVVMVKSRHAKPKAKTSWQTVLSVTPRERQMITDLITVVYTYHCVDNFKLKIDISCHQDIYLQVKPCSCNCQLFSGIDSTATLHSGCTSGEKFSTVICFLPSPTFFHSLLPLSPSSGSVKPWTYENLYDQWRISHCQEKGTTGIYEQTFF
jgi:hypothetical protein